MPQTFEKVRLVYSKPLHTDVPKQETLSDFIECKHSKERIKCGAAIQLVSTTRLIHSKGKGKWTYVPDHQFYVIIETIVSNFIE